MLRETRARPGRRWPRTGSLPGRGPDTAAGTPAGSAGVLGDVLHCDRLLASVVSSWLAGAGPRRCLDWRVPGHPRRPVIARREAMMVPLARIATEPVMATDVNARKQGVPAKSGRHPPFRWG